MLRAGLSTRHNDRLTSQTGSERRRASPSVQAWRKWRRIWLWCWQPVLREFCPLPCASLPPSSSHPSQRLLPGRLLPCHCDQINPGLQVSSCPSASFLFRHLGLSKSGLQQYVALHSKGPEWQACFVKNARKREVLIDWINDVLVEERIIVKQLEEDVYDGQVLQKLLEKLAGRKLNVAEVTQSEIGQKQKLQTVLEAVHDLLRPHGWAIKWNVDSIHGKNLVSILHLLVALAMHFRAPIRLPEHVSVQVVVVRKREGLLQTAQVTEELTTTTEMMMGRFERDAFDTLFDHAPDKLSVVKKSLITFVNKHLNKLNLEVTELETQFADGVYLVLLMGLLEDYFVPLHNFYLTPESFDQKVHNVSFAFELMQDGGLKKPKARPEDVVNLDLKSTLRVLYNLFTKYKNVE
uniref:Parvin beta n=1 Tax=Podarcis muralis TaxID=64176 RepID=A0A670HRY8_PODMU